MRRKDTPIVTHIGSNIKLGYSEAFSVEVAGWQDVWFWAEKTPPWRSRRPVVGHARDAGGTGAVHGGVEGGVLPSGCASYAAPPSSITLKPIKSPRSCIDFMWSP